MTADDIRKRLESADVRVVLEVSHYDAAHNSVMGAGHPSAWQKALGPTKEQVRMAVWDNLLGIIDDDDIDDVMGDIMDSLYPKGG